MSADVMQFDQIDHFPDALALESQWAGLWNRCPDATAFMLPEWVLGCWECLSTTDRRGLLTARHDGTLVALLALRYSPSEITLEGSEVSDYLEILIDPTFRDVLAMPLLSSLDELSQWRRFRFERLTVASPLLDLAVPMGWQVTRSEQDVCPYVKLSATDTSLKSAVPCSFLRRIEQSRRAATRHFRVEISSATPANASECLERLFGLHTTRWNGRGEAGVFAEPEIRRFHSQVVPRLIAREHAWLLELTFDATPVASLLALCGHRKVLYYIGGFDTQYATFSPGRLLIAALFERALHRGFDEVDFLRGVEPYKYDWGARNRNTYRLIFEAEESRACATG